MTRKSMCRIFIWCVCWIVASSGSVQAQDGYGVVLQILVRASDGSAIAGERVVLERLPDEEAIQPNCLTDAGGSCSWQVSRGLYQVLFTRPLDEISALSVAEGGLRGFGLTVGDVPITYHFVFYNDGRVYFDSAPEKAVPAPIIPSPDELHGGVVTVPISITLDVERVAITPTVDAVATPELGASPSRNRTWLLLIVMSLGLMVGGGLHLWSRQRKKLNQAANGEKADA